MKTRDEMIDVAARSIDEHITASEAEDHARRIIDALIAAGVIPDPETTAEANLSLDSAIHHCLALGWKCRILPYGGEGEYHGMPFADVIRDNPDFSSSALGRDAGECLWIAIESSIQLEKDGNADPVPYVAIGNGEPVPPALQALYESMVENWK